VVTVGRLGDMFGRVRMYNLGFVIFTVASIFLALLPSTGRAGAIELIIARMVQGTGGAFLMAAKRLSEYREIVASHGKDLAIGADGHGVGAFAFDGLHDFAFRSRPQLDLAIRGGG